MKSDIYSLADIRLISDVIIRLEQPKLPAPIPVQLLPVSNSKADVGLKHLYWWYQNEVLISSADLLTGIGGFKLE